MSIATCRPADEQKRIVQNSKQVLSVWAQCFTCNQLHSRFSCATRWATPLPLVGPPTLLHGCSGRLTCRSFLYYRKTFFGIFHVAGFTKVRSPTSAEAASGGARGGRSEAETSWWEFKHPHFRRGRRELLGEIKRREDKRAPSSSGTSGKSSMMFSSGNIHQ